MLSPALVNLLILVTTQSLTRSRVSTGAKDDDNNDAPAQRGAKRWNSENLLQNLFHPREFPALSRTIEEKLEDLSAVYMPYPNDGPLEDHSEIFLTHARVYRFSNRAGWISLNAVAFYNLAHALHDFTLFKERVTDIVGLQFRL